MRGWKNYKSFFCNEKKGLGEKNRFCRIARRSTTGCAATLDILRRLNPVADGDVRPGEEILLEILSMLTQLIKSLDAGKG